MEQAYQSVEVELLAQEVIWEVILKKCYEDRRIAKKMAEKNEKTNDKVW
jgi:hypothetical protein